MRIMSYNIRNCVDDKGEYAWENRRDALIKQINTLSPDLLGCQEVYHRQLTDILGGVSGYSYTGIGRDDGRQAGEYSPIFYKTERFELTGNGNFWLCETPDRPVKGWDASCIRICTYALLTDKTNGNGFAYYNTHLDCDGQTAILNGAKLIYEHAKTKHLPTFITGDFNTHEHTAAYDVFAKNGYCDSKYIADKSMSYGTYHAYGHFKDIATRSPIDYIFFTENDFNVSIYKVHNECETRGYASDHFAITMEFEWNT